MNRNQQNMHHLAAAFPNQELAADSLTLVWQPRLAELGDNDAVHAALQTCIDSSQFMPSWAEFRKAYDAALTKAHSPIYQPYKSEPVPDVVPLPIQKLREAVERSRERTNEHNLKPGDRVRMNLGARSKPASGAADHNFRRCGRIVKWSPDAMWLWVQLDGDSPTNLRCMAPKQLLPETQQENHVEPF